MFVGLLTPCAQKTDRISGMPAERDGCNFGCDVQSASAATPYYPFEEAEPKMLETTQRRWHKEYENSRNYGESWFFLVYTKQGGVLFANISITNLGLRTFDSAIDIRFYAPEGKVYRCFKDYRRQDLFATAEGLDLTIGGSHLKGDENAYYLSIDEAQFQMDLTLVKTLPSFQFGNGRVDFYKDRSVEWNLNLDAPRADASGTLTAEGKMFSLVGNGYHDHTWATIMLPTFMEKWYSLRFFQERFSIVIFQIHLTRKFGGGMLCAGLIGDGSNLTPIRSFLYKPLKWRREQTSGLDMPTELQLCIKTADYSITGSIKEMQFLDSIDVLARVPWPIRKIVKATYTRPFLIRYLARCDLDVTRQDGVRQQISVTGVAGLNSY